MKRVNYLDRRRVMRNAWRFYKRWKRSFTPEGFRNMGFTFARALKIAWDGAKLAARVAAMP